MSDQFAADTRLWTFADVSTGTVVRSTQFDTSEPPFDDPVRLERALDWVLDSVSPYGVPRVVLTANSGRPVVLPDPRRQVSVVIPDVELTQAQIDAANRATARHPYAETGYVKVAK